MTPAERHQLLTLDRAVLSLLNERARLLADVERDDAQRHTAVEDLLRRHKGPFAVDALRRVLALLEEGCLQ